MLIEKSLRYAIYTGLLAVLFVPFITFNDFFFPFITGKGFAFRIIVEIVFALWVLLALKNTLFRPHKSGLLLAVGLFILTLLVSVFLSENPEKNFWSNFERMEGWVLIAHLGAYFTVLVSMFRSEKLWRLFLNVSIGVSVIIGLYGVLQLLGFFTINQGGVRVDGTFGNATYLAVYMLFHVFITTLALTQWSRAVWVKVAYSIALILQVTMIFFAATRGTTLGLLGGMFLAGLIFTLFSKGNKTLKRVGISAVLIIVLLAGGFFAVRGTDFVQNHNVLARFANISLSEADTRFTIWGMALEGGLERPVFGWGQESFSYIFNEKYKPSLYAQEPWFDRAHNAYLDWFVAGGFPAIIIYLSFFAFALWYLWRRGNPFAVSERAIITGLLAGYGFHNMFVFDNLMSYVLFFTVLAYILSRHTREIPTTQTKNENSNEDTTQHKVRIPVITKDATFSAVSAVVVVVLGVTLYVVNVPSMVRATTLIEALQQHEEGLSKNLEYFKQTVQGSGIGKQEAHEQLVRFATQLHSAELQNATTPEFRAEVAQYATTSFSSYLDLHPNDARLRLFFGSFLRAIGSLNKAEEQLAIAQQLSPNKQAILFERAILSINLQKEAEALQLFKEAFELEPRYDLAREYYIATALRAGEKELAEQLLIERYDTLTPDSGIILQAYIDTGDFEKVIHIAEARVEKDPTNFDLRTQLAGAYLLVERRADAIQQLREAGKLRPEVQSQVDQYIQQIQAGEDI